MNVHSLGQLVMLAPASPRTLALIPPSNQALNQMVSQPFIFYFVLEPKTHIIFIIHRKIFYSSSSGLLFSRSRNR